MRFAHRPSSGPTFALAPKRSSSPPRMSKLLYEQLPALDEGELPPPPSHKPRRSTNPLKLPFIGLLALFVLLSLYAGGGYDESPDTPADSTGPHKTKGHRVVSLSEEEVLFRLAFHAPIRTRLSPRRMTVIPPSARRHDATLVILHDVGQLSTTLPLLALAKKFPTLRIVAPTSPKIALILRNNTSISAWYNPVSITSLLEEDQDFEGMKSSQQRINGLLRDERDLLLEQGKHSRIVLAGYGQGATMALLNMLTAKTPLLGVLALSGVLAQFSSLDKMGSLVDETTPVFLGHEDSALAREESNATLTRLRDGPIWMEDVSSRLVDQSRGMDEIEEWLAEVLGVEIEGSKKVEELPVLETSGKPVQEAGIPEEEEAPRGEWLEKVLDEVVEEATREPSAKDILVETEIGRGTGRTSPPSPPPPTHPTSTKMDKGVKTMAVEVEEDEELDSNFDEITTDDVDLNPVQATPPPLPTAAPQIKLPTMLKMTKPPSSAIAISTTTLPAQLSTTIKLQPALQDSTIRLALKEDGESTSLKLPSGPPAVAPPASLREAIASPPHRPATRFRPVHRPIAPAVRIVST